MKSSIGSFETRNSFAGAAVSPKPIQMPRTSNSASGTDKFRRITLGVASGDGNQDAGANYGLGDSADHIQFPGLNIVTAGGHAGALDNAAQAIHGNRGGYKNDGLNGRS